MDKEKIITVGIGLLVGFLAATGYFTLSKYLPSLKNLPDKVTLSPQTPPSPPPSKETLRLDLEDFTSTTEATIQITGKSTPNAKIILFANTDEKIATSDAAGNFSANLKLEDGDNQISATAFDSRNNATALIKRNVTLEISQ